MTQSGADMLIGVLCTLKHWFMPGTMNALAQLRAENQRLSEQVAQWQQRALETEQRINAHVNAVVGNVIRRSSADAYFECDFNGVVVFLPRHTLCTMTHCIHPRADGPLPVLVETFHTDWLRNKLRSGDVFVDVGASTGAMTIPIAKSFPEVRIVAFEPNRTTCRVLKETLAKNGIAGVELSSAAVSDTTGKLTFVELPNDPTGNTPWLPESSSLLTTALSQAKLGESYEAQVTTLDVFFGDRGDRAKVRAIKIDVEGFEIHVLRGAMRLLGEQKPYLAIDIHRNPFDDGTTEAGCRAILSSLGYSFAKEGHVLLGSPPSR